MEEGTVRQEYRTTGRSLPTAETRVAMRKGKIQTSNGTNLNCRNSPRNTCMPGAVHQSNPRSQGILKAVFYHLYYIFWQWKSLCLKYIKIWKNRTESRGGKI